MRSISTNNIEVWGGMECSINRIGDQFFDQLAYSGHYDRQEDIQAFIDLGISKIRYPVLWEKNQPIYDGEINWSETEERLHQLRDGGIEIIAGLVHHGSGPAYVDMLDDTFADGLADYAAKVAEKFPWIEYYTPVNEPLTTARFCGLYGLWYPHKNDDKSFCRILINECKATVLAMQRIRTINPNAKLVQTDDLGKIHSTPLLNYQADFENNRRWLSYDLLCGKVTHEHPLWCYLLDTGIKKEELLFFEVNKCEPDVMGFNHYLTSERYLDENTGAYPPHTHGGNAYQKYADVEAVRVGHICPDGPYKLLKQAWERYKLPLAVTEVHLYCTREEQMRWLHLLWQAANQLKQENVDIVAITPWALLGSFGWNRLLTQPDGEYETGVFDLGNGYLRPTALEKMIKTYSSDKSFIHPVINNNGWWQRKCRVVYGNEAFYNQDDYAESRPVLITCKNSVLGNAFARICDMRGITYKLASKDELDITDASSVKKLIAAINPWAIINTAGFLSVDDAETASGHCYAINTLGPGNLAILCEKHGIKLLTFSTDMVFDGLQTRPYLEHDKISPLNVYGHSKAEAELIVLYNNPSALIVRTSALFSPWDNQNFINLALTNLQNEKHFKVLNDVMVSPTYVPDLVNKTLDLLLDDETGIWHLTNNGHTTWQQLAFTIADRFGLKTNFINPVPLMHFGFKAKRPLYSVLNSSKGNLLPSLDHAVDRCLSEIK